MGLSVLNYKMVEKSLLSLTLNEVTFYLKDSCLISPAFTLKHILGHILDTKEKHPFTPTSAM